LWFYEETAPFAFSLADELTEATALLIARCAWEDDAEPLPEVSAGVVDLAAVRLSRLGEGGRADVLEVR
jgi:hypothetical protein